MEDEKEKIEERVLLFKKCFDYSTNDIDRLLSKVSADDDLIELFKGAKTHYLELLKKKMASDIFYGKYYTVQKGELFLEGSWERIREKLLEGLYGDQGKLIFEILNFMLKNSGEADFASLKAHFSRLNNPLTILVGYGLVIKEKIGESIRYKIPKEIIPLIRETLINFEAVESSLLAFESEIAKKELDQIKSMDEEFEEHLVGILENNIPEILDFGKEADIGFIADYLERMFGNLLYFDSLLAISQQYSLADSHVVNQDGNLAMRTGFNLALFGAPGSGKTFSINNMILGDKEKGVMPHGLPGRNRYCGGITPARFIWMGEAYQDRRFNFIVTEFNDWFKYKGMVEPLKLALEQGKITYETKRETVGPYSFSSFFSTNYNTKVLEQGYRITVADPNFNAIEDRMLCRLHKMTEERYRAIADSQKALALGKIKTDKADLIRDHLTLIYAIQTQHRTIKDKYSAKSILLTSEIYSKIDKAKEFLLKALRQIKSKIIPFSPRLERRAIQLAGAMSLPSYFKSDDTVIKVDERALQFAIKFFVEEAVIRSQEKINQEEVLSQVL
jgi:hypothetical protein